MSRLFGVLSLTNHVHHQTGGHTRRRYRRTASRLGAPVRHRPTGSKPRFRLSPVRRPGHRPRAGDAPARGSRLVPEPGRPPEIEANGVPITSPTPLRLTGGQNEPSGPDLATAFVDAAAALDEQGASRQSSTRCSPLARSTAWSTTGSCRSSAPSATPGRPAASLSRPSMRQATQSFDACRPRSRRPDGSTSSAPFWSDCQRGAA